MEVILALMLFVGAAAIVTGGMNASLQTLDRTRLGMHASNLAVSIMSELHMGLRPAVTAGPEPFEAPYEEWTWELVVTELSLSDAASENATPATASFDGEFAAAGPLPVVLAEVIIRHGFESTVHRLAQVVPVVPTVELEQSTVTGEPAADRNGEGEVSLP